MKSKTKKLITVILAILFVALILNAIFTWGITFECDGGFKWSKDYIFEDIFPDKQIGTIQLGENPNNPVFCIPLVVWVYGIEAPPYVILLDIEDEKDSLEKIVIESVTIEYADGKKIDNNINWERKFKRTPIIILRDSENVNTFAMQLVDKLPVTVDKRQSCHIRFVGYFVNKDEEKIPFDITKYFEYRPRRWRIYPARDSF